MLISTQLQAVPKFKTRMVSPKGGLYSSIRCELSYFYMIIFLLSWRIATGKFVSYLYEKDLVSCSMFCSGLIYSGGVQGQVGEKSLSDSRMYCFCGGYIRGDSKSPYESSMAVFCCTRVVNKLKYVLQIN